MWAKYTLEQIVSGKSADGSLLLEGFLKEYAKLEGVSLSSLQPSCPTCLNRYYNEYILKHTIMKNKSQYKLHKRYNGISLGFGSQILLTNANLTDEYAEQLILRYLDVYEKRSEKFDIKVFFEEYPENWEDAHFEEAEEEVDEVEETKEVIEEGLFNEDSNLNLKQLRSKYPDIKAGSIVDFLSKIKN